MVSQREQRRVGELDNNHPGKPSHSGMSSRYCLRGDGTARKYPGQGEAADFGSAELSNCVNGSSFRHVSFARNKLQDANV